MSENSWQPIETAPRDGTVIQVTALEPDGSPFEIWPVQWSHIARNELFAPGMVGMWIVPDGSATWREGDGGPTHWRSEPQNNAPQTAETQAQSTTSPPLINQV